MTIPDTVWMVATFSTPQAGWIIAGEAETGSTENRIYSATPGSCNTTFSSDYAGLWANLICQEGARKARATGSGPVLRMEAVEAPVTIKALEVAP